MNQFVAIEGDAKKRLDVFVVEQLPLLSRAYIRKLIDDDKVQVNKASEKAGYWLREGDKVTVDYDSTELSQIPDIDIPIIYEDSDCIVIDKPSGLLTHSKGAFNPEATVATWLRQMTEGKRQKTEDGGSDRVGIVHRLDRATSGVMILAKNQTAMSWLQKQFSTRKVKKTYIALVTGELAPTEAVIDMPIERHPRRPQTFRVGAQGKPSKTHYRVLEARGQEATAITQLELKPETGRTHQLRVHLKHLGHPIIGDTFYQGLAAPRLFLHALNLELTLPNRERKVFTAPLPKEFKQYLDNTL